MESRESIVRRELLGLMLSLGEVTDLISFIKFPILVGILSLAST